MDSKDVRIAVCNRRWMVVGRYSQEGMSCTMRGSYIIRRWGTDKGLGQLAATGPRENTILFPSGTVDFNHLTSVVMFRCNQDWDKVINEAQEFKPEHEAQSEKDDDVRIAVCNRRWMIVGRFSQKGMICTMESSYIIRRWGTDKGLGQLAVTGPREETILFPSGTIDFNNLTSVIMFRCIPEMWNETLNQDQRNIV